MCFSFSIHFELSRGFCVTACGWSCFTTPSHFIIVSVLWSARASKTTGDVDFLDASCHLPGAPMLRAATQNKHLDIAVHVIVVICSPHTLPRPKVYSLLLCMWHCSTTAYPACHEDRGERNSLFDSGSSGRLWHVAPKIHHWIIEQIPRPISHRTLGLCMGFSETSQHMFLYCNQNIAPWWYTGWSFCKKNEGRNGHNTKMIEPRHGPTKT